MCPLCVISVEKTKNTENGIVPLRFHIKWLFLAKLLLYFDFFWEMPKWDVEEEEGCGLQNLA